MGFPVQATDIIKQISVTGASRVIDKFADGWFLNAIQNGYGVATDVKTMADGDFEKGFTSLVEKCKDFILSMVLGEASKSQQEVTNTQNKAEEINNKSKQLSVQMEGDFDEISESIDKQSEIVKDANKEIEKTQKEIEEQQKEIEKIVAEIAAKQAELANKPASEQAKILAEIQGLASQITAISSTVIDLEENVENLTSAVEDSVKNIETATDKMTVVEEEGNTQIAQLNTESAEVTEEVIESATKGAGNATKSAEATTLAATASTNVVTGATVAPKLYEVAADQGTASTVRLGSIANNFNRIAEGIGNIANNSAVISSFKNTIGNAIDDFSGLIGSWETFLSPVISSIGSFTEINDGVEELNDYVKTDFNTIGYSINNEGKVTQNTENNTTDKQKTEVKSTKKNQETQNDLLTPTYDTKKISRSFGI